MAERAFKTGDLVQLKSGSLPMIVYDILYQDRTVVRVRYTNVDYEIMDSGFPAGSPDPLFGNENPILGYVYERQSWMARTV